ncbi:MAG: hypothetical protein AAF823_13665 [Planctomycetota bacterium]
MREVSLDEAEKVFGSGTPEDICRVLIQLALHETDGERVLLWCAYFLNHENTDVASAAATGIGHLARLGRRMDVDAALEVLECTKKRRAHIETIEDALGDVRMFRGKPRR